MKISREVRIGVFGMITLALFIISVNYIKGKDLFHRHRVFYAIYDGTSGIQDAAPISINGLNIGKVTDLGFLNDKSSKILMELGRYSRLGKFLVEGG